MPEKIAGQKKATKKAMMAASGAASALILRSEFITGILSLSEPTVLTEASIADFIHRVLMVLFI